jgi:hypothetical protein
MSDDGNNIWSDDDFTERMMNMATLHVPLAGKEMGCALMFLLPVGLIVLIGGWAIV